MKSFTIRLAGQYFTICPVCDYIREYCKDYIVADDAVHGIGDSATGRETGNVTGCTTNGTLETPSRFRIATNQSDIDFEREKSAREVLWSSIFVTFVAKKIIGLLLGYYRSLPCM